MYAPRLPRRFGRWSLRAALFAVGFLSLMASATFLLATEWDGEAAPDTNARSGAPAPDEGGQPSDAGKGAEPPASKPGGAGPTPTPAGTLDVAPALAAVDGERLFEGLVQLAGDLAPTPTPKPTEPPPPPPPPAPSNPEPTPRYVGPIPTPRLPAPPPAARADPGCPTAGMGGFGLDLFNAINRERSAAGVAQLQAHGCVVYVAQLRSNDMASRGYFSHTSPDGSTAFSLLDQYRVPHGWAGENLARNNYPNDQTVAVAIRDLMASPGHRDNILSTNFTHLGVAAVNDGAGMWYYTMVFIGPP
jgi:uncharacterized protein YkwD